MLKIHPQKIFVAKSEGKELYTFSREIKKDAETAEAYGFLLPEGTTSISQYSYIICVPL